ncbi:MAG: sugar nucleotide-binding protein [Candidatus Omnitrophica bacterium]|nr:sugar nucleotide-binding protein [Candidatus Omnitrophota bacterium]
MNKDILILGKGFIGKHLQKGLNCKISDSWIESYKDAERVVKKYKPKTIINCIGITGRRNVDDCELDIDGVLLANSFIPVILAEVCLRNNIKLVHISSGCIFNFDYKKDKPIKEDSEDYFFRLFYSRSKIYAERAIEKLARDYNILILRIRIPLTNEKHPKNLLDKLLKYKKVIDIPNSVTYIPDFILAVKHLLKINAKGVYNLVNKGELRYPELMRVYQKYFPEYKLKVIPLKNLRLVRTNLLLSTDKLSKTGFKIKDIKGVLGECVQEYIKHE